MGEHQDHTDFVKALVSPDSQQGLPVHTRLELALQALPQTWQTLIWYVDIMDEPAWRIGLLMGIQSEELPTLIGCARARLSEAYREASVENSGRSPHMVSAS